MHKPKKLDKGMRTEELLRMYFLRAGYYVARGVPFIYKGFDVTDIDLWLYSRTSSVSREIMIVDIKNKKTPQAIERIFWVQGLKQAVNANKAIVATTEKRKEVKEFGNNLGILVLDGQFMSKLKTFEVELSSRLSDEDFLGLIDRYELEKIDGQWKTRIKKSKSVLSKELSFDSVNYWLENACFFAEQALVKQRQEEIAMRCFYLLCSFVALAIDYLLQELSFLGNSERVNALTEGFTYGSKGRNGTLEILNMSMSFIEQYAEKGASMSSEVREGINEQFSKLPAPILGEFFGRNDVGKQLFHISKEFEHLAMQKAFSTHHSSSTELKSMIGCLLDFWDLDRTSFNFAISE